MIYFCTYSFVYLIVCTWSKPSSNWSPRCRDPLSATPTPNTELPRFFFITSSSSPLRLVQSSHLGHPLFEALLLLYNVHSLLSSPLARCSSKALPAQTTPLRIAPPTPSTVVRSTTLHAHRKSLRNMLLPSALPCDAHRTSRFTPSRLFSTPPPSDNDSGLPGNGLLGTCRALQSLLNGSPAPSSRRRSARLQSPLTFQPALPSPASSRKNRSSRSTTIQPPSPAPAPRPARGANKRRRNTYEDDLDMDINRNTPCSFVSHNPSTPKRPRHLPYELPLGLSQTDFYSLHSPPITQSPPSARQQDTSSSYNPDAALPSIEESDEPAPEPAPEPTDPQTWSTDDDEHLVELVLEKFQLSKSDLDDCARRMGKDHASVGQRWQALLGEGTVGLRRGRRMVRSRIHKDWM